MPTSTRTVSFEKQPGETGPFRETTTMTPRSHHTSAAPVLLMATLVVLAVQPATIDAQTPATGQAAPPTASASGGDQPQAVATSGSTFWTSFGYLLITLLIAGSLYAICRSSHRT